MQIAILLAPAARRPTSEGLLAFASLRQWRPSWRQSDSEALFATQIRSWNQKCNMHIAWSYSFDFSYALRWCEGWRWKAMAHLVTSQTMTGFSIVVISSHKVISCLPHCNKATREAARPIVHHFTSAYKRRMPNINVKHPTNNYVRTRPLAWYIRLRCTQRRSIVLLRLSFYTP